MVRSNVTALHKLLHRAMLAEVLLREGRYHDYRWDGVGLSMFCLRLGLVIVLTAFVWIRMYSPPQIMI